jgi:hypothetical protein
MSMPLAPMAISIFWPSPVAWVPLVEDLLLNSDGQRFSDELGHRDYVSGKMWEEKEKGKWLGSTRPVGWT